MITGQSDPLMCFNTFLLLAFDLKSTAKPEGAMLPLAPPLLPHSKTRGALLPLAPPTGVPANFLLKYNFNSIRIRRVQKNRKY